MDQYQAGCLIYDAGYNAFGYVYEFWRDANVLYIVWLTGIGMCFGEHSDIQPDEGTRLATMEEVVARLSEELCRRNVK